MKEETVTLEEVWKLFKETDLRFKETDKKIQGLADLFTSQWGKLVEALVAPGCLKLFQDRNIDISQSYENVESKKGGRQMELDVMLVNDTELVVVEVKTTMKVYLVKQFLEKLKEFKTFFPQYQNYKVYGAVAAIKFQEKSEVFAESHGLFVIKTSGEGILSLENPSSFKPKSF